MIVGFATRIVANHQIGERKKMKRLFTTTLILAVSIFILTACGGKKIDLTDTYDISYSGNDGEGVARINLNGGALESQLNIKGQNEKEMKFLFDFMAFESSVQYKVVPEKDLKNGQTIKVICTWDKEIAKRLKLSPVFKEKEITIPMDAFRVIRKVEEDEVFADIVVQVTGVYPKTEVRVQYGKTTKVTERVDLTLEDIDYEKKTVRVSAKMTDYNMDQLGISLEPMTKELPLGDYSRYITDLKTLDKGNRKKILDQAKNAVIAFIENERTGSSYSRRIFPYAYEKEEKEMRKYEAITLDSVYFLTLKKGMEPNSRGWFSSNGIYNQSIYVMKATVFHHEKPEGEIVFIPVLLDNIIEMSTGELDYQLSEVKVYEEQINTSDADYKSVFINKYIDKYDGIVVAGNTFEAE